MKLVALVVCSMLAIGACTGCAAYNQKPPREVATKPGAQDPWARWKPVILYGVVYSAPGVDANERDMINKWRIVVAAPPWILQMYININVFPKFQPGTPVRVYGATSPDGLRFQVFILETYMPGLPDSGKSSKDT